MDTSTLISVSGSFMKYIGEALAEVKRQELAKLDAAVLKKKRDVLAEKLQEAQSSLDAAARREKAKVEQDLMSRGLGNPTVRDNSLRAIETDAALELDRVSREYNRAIEEIALMEQRLAVESQSPMMQLGKYLGQEDAVFRIAACTIGGASVGGAFWGYLGGSLGAVIGAFCACYSILNHK